MVNQWEFKYDGETIKVAQPGSNFKDWVIIEQESLSYNKGDKILERWNNDFPHFKMDDYEKLTEACSRTRKFSEWLTMANLEYSNFAQLPKFLDGEVSPEIFQEKQTKLNSINKTVSKFSKEKKELSEKYKIDLREIENTEKKEVDKILNKDKILKVLAMNSTRLPFSLQLNIQGYTPSDTKNNQESRQSYGREVLIQYKKALIQTINRLPDVDIDALIDANELK